MATSSQIPAVAWPLLNAIRQVESANQYNRMYGNQQTGNRYFSDFSRHPNSRVMGPDGPSSAAGGYQFIKSTWDRAATALGLGDFSPENQDRAAWWLAQNDYRARTGRSLEADLRAGQIDQVRRELSPTWRALQDNPSGFMSAYRSSPQASTGGTNYQNRVGSTAPQPFREAQAARGRGASPVLEAIRQRLRDRGRTETPILDRMIERRRRRAEAPQPFRESLGLGNPQPTPGPLSGRQDKAAPWTELGQGVNKLPPPWLQDSPLQPTERTAFPSASPGYPLAMGGQQQAQAPWNMTAPPTPVERTYDPAPYFGYIDAMAGQANKPGPVPSPYVPPPYLGAGVGRPETPPPTPSYIGPNYGQQMMLNGLGGYRTGGGF